MPVRIKPRAHEFTVMLAQVEELTPEIADVLYQIFDDGTAGSCNGVVSIDFHREAPSFQEAVRSAIEDVRKADLDVVRIETEESRFVEQINEGLVQAS